MNFANNLQKLRKRENMSQEALAEKLDVTRQSVSKWESAATYPEMDKLIAICKIFKVDMDSLINGDPLEEKERKENKNISSKEIFDKFDSFMKKVVCYFENITFKELVAFIATVLILILVILILRIPVEIIQSLIGDHFLYNIGETLGPILYKIFNLIVDIIYIIFSIALFIYALKIKYIDKIKVEKKKEIKNIIIKEEQEEKKEVIEKIIIREENDHKLTKLLTKIIFYILKFFAIFWEFTIFICLVCIAASIGFLTFGLIKGIPVLGILLAAISVLALTTVIFEVLFNFIVNQKNKYKRIIITIGSSLILFIIASTIFVFEFLSITYINDVPKEAKKEKIVNTYNMTDSFNTTSVYGYITYETDESLKDEVVVEVSYYDYIAKGNMEISFNNDTLHIYRGDLQEINLSKIVESISEDLKNNKIYNYNKLANQEIIIKSSTSNINKIKENNYNVYYN